MTKKLLSLMAAATLSMSGATGNAATTAFTSSFDMQNIDGEQVTVSRDTLTFLIEPGLNVFELSINGICSSIYSFALGGYECGAQGGNDVDEYLFAALEPLNILTGTYEVTTFDATLGFYAEARSRCGGLLPAVQSTTGPKTFTTDGFSGIVGTQNGFICSGALQAERVISEPLNAPVQPPLSSPPTYDVVVEFRINAESLVPIPLPAGLPLLIAGLGVLGAASARRKKNPS